MGYCLKGYFCSHLMVGLHKFSLNFFLTVPAIFLLVCLTTWSVRANHIKNFTIYSSLTTDTVPSTQKLNAAQKDSARLSKRKQSIVVAADTLPKRVDTTGKGNRDSVFTRVDSFSLKFSKDTLDGPVSYEAEDSAVVLAPEKKIILYGKAKTVYKDVTLTAPKIALDQSTNILTAYNQVDSLGEVVTRARFEEKENKFESDTIRFNFKTKQGLTKNTFTQQNEMFIQGEVIKKVDSATVFIKRGRFTTCDLDEPHFAFRANKLKVINSKVAVSGPMHPEFEGVPIPIYLPFGYYPLSKGRHSGFLPPQFTATENYGLGLEGLGYYKILNDNFDLTLRGNVYSYGGWRADVTSSYRVRYRYNGSFNVSLQNTKISFKGDPDYLKSKTFFITWSHSVDQRARPGVNFSASVNAGSTKYNQFITNNVMRNFQNQLGSSIAYSKTWKDKPFNLTLTANHNQNNATRLINLILPDAGFTVNTLYPFERKEAIGAARWYEKLGIGYNGTARNQLSFYDTAVSFKRLLDTLQWGASHSIPLTVALPPLGPLLVSPSISYQQQWSMRRLYRSWNPALKKVDTSFQKGFYTAHNLSVGMGFNTSFFGTYQFKHSNLIAIRHSVRPTLSLSYSPNLARNYYRTVQIDSTGKDFLHYSLYEGNLYTGYNDNEFGGVSFGIDNSLEMKMRSKKDSGENAIKKVRLIDGFGFNSNYNFLLDSLQLGDFNLYLRSTLFDKINLNFGAILTPYETDQYGRRIARYVWKNGFKPGRITTGNVSLSTSFRSKPRDPSKKSQPTQTNINRSTDPSLLNDQQRLQDYMRRNPNEFVDFNIPYDFGIDLAMSFSRQLQPDLRSYKTVFNSSLNFHNSFSLTPKWNFTSNGYFDLKTKKLQAFSLSVNREMHCWQMSISISPVGFNRYFNITLSPKSSILQNLRINRTRVFSSY